jgi:hypothetical protein
VSELDRDLQLLHRFHDGELSGLERWLFERRLRRSPGLQRELRALRDVSTQISRAGLEPEPADAPDLWAAIASALPAVDAQVVDERAGAARRASAASAGAERGKVPPRPGAGWLGLPGWAAGAAALAAVAVVAVVVARLPDDGPAPLAEPVAISAPMVARGDGVVRYIDSGGAPVMVIEDEDAEMTIVWMMEAV